METVSSHQPMLFDTDTDFDPDPVRAVYLAANGCKGSPS
jgi:hypothetical protein